MLCFPLGITGRDRKKSPRQRTRLKANATNRTMSANSRIPDSYREPSNYGITSFYCILRSMRKIAVLLLGFVSAATLAPSIEREPSHVFAARRARLLEKLSDGVIVVFGYTAMEGESLRSPFRQESNFYYLTGWNEPGAILMLTPRMKERSSPLFETINQMPREILYLPAHNSREEQWTGPKAGPYDAGLHEKTGFEIIRGAELFERELSKAVAGFGKIYTLKP